MSVLKDKCGLKRNPSRLLEALFFRELEARSRLFSKRSDNALTLWVPRSVGSWVVFGQSKHWLTN